MGKSRIKIFLQNIPWVTLVRLLLFYGMGNIYYSVEPDYNPRLDELHAAILLRKLSHLDKYIARRREIADEYDKSLAMASLSLPKTMPGNEHVYHLYVSRHPESDRIISPRIISEL